MAQILNINISKYAIAFSIENPFKNQTQRRVMMATSYTATNNIYTTDAEEHKKSHYARLFRRFILLTVVCSLIPLLLVGWGINIHYTRFANARMVNYFQTQIEYHRKIIEMLLKERSSKLQLIAH